MSYGFNNDKSRFPLGAASDLPDPTKTPLKIIGELQNQIIDSASIENGATASKAYASGDYVCFQGALCKASKAISQGDTLSIGDSANDNLTLTDAAAEFARINSNLSKRIEFNNYDQSVVQWNGADDTFNWLFKFMSINTWFALKISYSGLEYVISEDGGQTWRTIWTK